MSDDWRIIIAFSEPPARYHFIAAKSQKTWFRKIEGRVWAIQLAQELKKLNIHGVIKKCDPPPANPERRSSRSVGFGKAPTGFGGALNAAPMTGNWRIKKRRKIGPGRS